MCRKSALALFCERFGTILLTAFDDELFFELEILKKIVNFS